MKANLPNFQSRVSFFSMLSLLLFINVYKAPETITKTTESTLAISTSIVNVCPNPEFTGCLAPDDPSIFRVLLVLDESASMRGARTQSVKDMIDLFATTLQQNVTSSNQMELGIIEFSDANKSSDNLPLKDVNDADFISAVNAYKNNYDPGRYWWLDRL